MRDYDLSASFQEWIRARLTANDPIEIVQVPAHRHVHLLQFRYHKSLIIQLLLLGLRHLEAIRAEFEV